jgi:glycosyltransferase involved in cell wall biosynthesis
MTVSQPLVSVVTPVYNEARHLSECIDSVLAQTYANWDYTIVDNCSTDASVEIARQYAARDSRIRVVQNREFLTAFQNCNTAVRQISPASKYCKVVLGDDWMFPECLQRMVAVAEAHPSVGIVGAYALEGQAVALAGLPFETKVVSGRDACRRHLLNREYVFGTQTSVLYRSDLVRAHDPLYNEANVQADTETCFALLRTSDFGFVHQVLTFTRVRPGSLHMASLALETSWAAILHLLVTYGATYLTQDELRARLDEHMAAYYRFLGKSVLLRRDLNFWNYHKAQLAAAGMPLNRGRVAMGVLRYLVPMGPARRLRRGSARG